MVFLYYLVYYVRTLQIHTVFSKYIILVNDVYIIIIIMYITKNYLFLLLLLISYYYTNYGNGIHNYVSKFTNNHGVS